MKAERTVAMGWISLEAQGFAVLVAMEQFEPSTPSVRHVNVFINGESVIATQTKFRLHFKVARHARIPSRNTILLWVHNVRTTASATKKHDVSKRTFRTPENLEALRNAVDQSQR